MKIFIFDNDTTTMGGVQRIVANLANKFSEKYEVIVVSKGGKNSKQFFEINKKVKCFYLFSKTKLEKNKNKNIIFKSIYRIYNKYRNTLGLKLKLRNINKMINKDDIMIFARLQVAIDFIPNLKENNNIIIRDALVYECHTKKQKSEVIDILNNKVKLFIVSSDESKKVYEKELNKNHLCKIIKVYNPLTINPQNCYNYESKRIVCVGRYDKQKGYDFLLNVFKIVNKELPEFKLDIIGPKCKELDDLISERKLENKVNVYSGETDIVKALKDTTLCISASRYEGYANSLVETAACSIPNISVDWLCGVEEIIDDNNNGEIYHLSNRMDYFNYINDPKDEVNFANKIIKLLKDKNKLDKYSKNSNKIINTREGNLIFDKWVSEIEKIENENK